MKAMVIHLALVMPSRGGRRTPMETGYVGNLRADGRITAVELTFSDRDELSPGAVCYAIARLPNWEYVADRICLGSEFEVIEGARVVGKGKVIEFEGPESSE